MSEKLKQDSIVDGKKAELKRKQYIELHRTKEQEKKRRNRDEANSIVGSLYNIEVKLAGGQERAKQWTNVNKGRAS